MRITAEMVGASTLPLTSGNKRIPKPLAVATVSCLTAIWVAGIVFHDSWLRPWPMILAWCAGFTFALFCICMLLRFGYRVAAGVLFVLIVVLAVPAPSFKRSASVDNQTRATVSIRVSSIDGAHFKEAQVPPGKKWDFIYFIEGVREIGVKF